jgi:hypothetical protein
VARRSAGTAATSGGASAGAAAGGAAAGTSTADAAADALANVGAALKSGFGRLSLAARVAAAAASDVPSSFR